jgi:2-iminobutanoate/2-iminopropanoate deaminase
MSREPIRTDRAPTNAHYAQAVRAAGLVFVSGQGPFDAATGAIVGATIQEQVRQCLTNIQAILEVAGSSIEKIVSSTFILGDPADFAGLNEEWDRWFSDSPPARQGAKLPLDMPGLRVSIAAIAEA